MSVFHELSRRDGGSGKQRFPLTFRRFWGVIRTTAANYVDITAPSFFKRRIQTSTRASFRELRGLHVTHVFLAAFALARLLIPPITRHESRCQVHPERVVEYIEDWDGSGFMRPSSVLSSRNYYSIKPTETRPLISREYTSADRVHHRTTVHMFEAFVGNNCDHCTESALT